MNIQLKKRYRAAILFWTAFIGIGAVAGSMMFFFDPENGFVMGGIRQTMQERMPFGDLLFSNLIFAGISLLIVNGITNITAFILILKNKRAGYIMGWLFGITLMLWICIQFWLFAPKVWPIDVVYFIFGLLQFICGYIAFVRFSQAEFASENAGITEPEVTNKKELVVYFSRMGYTKKLALEKAEQLHCGVLELKTTEPTAGDSGFWWCGRFGMHKWGMKLENSGTDIASYDKIYIFSPIWVFGLCAPVRQFISDNAKNIKSADITMLHFMNRRLMSAANTARESLGSRLENVESVCCKRGKFKHS